MFLVLLFEGIEDSKCMLFGLFMLLVVAVLLLLLMTVLLVIVMLLFFFGDKEDEGILEVAWSSVW